MNKDDGWFLSKVNLGDMYLVLCKSCERLASAASWRNKDEDEAGPYLCPYCRTEIGWEDRGTI